MLNPEVHDDFLSCCFLVGFLTCRVGGCGCVGRSVLSGDSQAGFKQEYWLLPGKGMARMQYRGTFGWWADG